MDVQLDSAAGEKRAMAQEQPPPYQDPQAGPGQFGGYPQQPYPGQPYQAQPYPGQPYPGQPYPGQPQPGQPYPGQPQAGQPYPGQPYPGQPYPGQGYPAQTVIAVQPQVPLTPPESDHLGYSIFTLLCCCMPLGIAALIYSINVRDANMRGDRSAATRGSRLARILNHTAVGVGLTVITIITIYVIVMVLAITGSY